MQLSKSGSLSLLGEFGNVALRGDDLAEIMDSAVKCVAEGLRVPKAAILLPRANDTLAAQAWVGWDDHVMSGLALDANGQDLCARAFRGEPATCLFDRSQGGGFWPEIHVASDISSVIGASIRSGEKRYGVVEAGAETIGHFVSSDSEFLATMTNLLAAAFVRLGHSPLRYRSTEAAPQLQAFFLRIGDQSLVIGSLIDQLPVGVAFRDAQGTILKSNVFYRHCASALILSDGYENARNVSEIAGYPAVEELSLRLPDGNTVRVKLEGCALHGVDNDQIITSCSIVTDITRSRLAQQALPNPDLPHRVRNLLSVIRVIARRTAERSESVDEYAAQMESRINAIARVQTAMFAGRETRVDLEMLISDELLAHSIKDDQVKVSGPRVSLWAKAADTLGLAIHELTENAIKYGALSVKSGRIEITWRRDDERSRLEFEWREFGVSVIGSAPRRHGFGHELIERTLPYELEATSSIVFRPGGILCCVTIPLESRTVPPRLGRGGAA